MAAIEWRAHRGVRYLHVTYSGTTSDQAAELLAESARLVEAEPHDVRVLVDVRDVGFDPRMLRLARSTSFSVFRVRRTRTVIVGLGGVPEQALRGMQRLGQLRETTMHATLDDALDGLVRD